MKTLAYKIIYNGQVNFVLRNLNKAIYKIFPGIVRIPVSGTLRIRMKNGERIRLRTNQTDFVSFCVFWNGLYSYEYMPVFEEVIRHCRTFIDIGANAGLYSIVAAKVSPEIKCIALDPSSASVHFVTENIRINKVEKQVKIFNVAASDRKSSAEFFEVKNPKYPYLDFNLGGASSLVIKPENFRTRTVECFDLDGFIAEKLDPDTPVDFVKIDAEGAEPAIIRGMGKTIQSHRPIIVCEVLYESVESELIRQLQHLGYKVFYAAGDKLSVKRGGMETPDANNCFFVPPDKVHLFQPFIS